MFKSPESHWTLHLVGCHRRDTVRSAPALRRGQHPGWKEGHPASCHLVSDLFTGYAGVILGTIRVVVVLHRLCRGGMVLQPPAGLQRPVRQLGLCEPPHCGNLLDRYSDRTMRSATVPSP